MEVCLIGTFTLNDSQNDRVTCDQREDHSRGPR